MCTGVKLIFCGDSTVKALVEYGKQSILEHTTHWYEKSELDGVQTAMGGKISISSKNVNLIVCFGEKRQRHKINTIVN